MDVELEGVSGGGDTEPEVRRGMNGLSPTILPILSSQCTTSDAEWPPSSLVTAASTQVRGLCHSMLRPLDPS